MTAVTHVAITAQKTKQLSSAVQAHTERFDASKKHLNKSIRPEDSARNINLLPDAHGTYKERFDKLLADKYNGRKRKDGTPVLRKDATKLVQIAVNLGQVDDATGLRIDELSEDDKVKFLREDVYNTLADYFGADNIIGASIHLDESQPHLHMDIVPLTPEGKLSAKDMLGGPLALSRHQTEWLEDLQAKRPDLNLQRKKDQDYNGMELDRLKQLTEDAKKEAGEWLKDMRAEYNARLHILSSAKNVQDREEVRLNSWERRLKQTEQAQTDKARELAQEQARLDEALPMLDKVSAEILETEKQQASKGAELDARERVLEGRESAVARREQGIDKTVAERTEKAVGERTRALDSREQAVEGRESAVARREQGIEKTVAERTEKAVGERTRALDSRERVLAGKEQDFDERLTAWERAKITLVDTLQKIPTAMQALAWWRKQSEDEDADKVADAIAEQVDAHTDKAITALADERLDEVQEHTNALTKTTDALEDGLDPTQFDLPDARELPSAQEVAESVNIDPSQFEITKRQLTQG
jgi:hypothetical protein